MALLRYAEQERANIRRAEARAIQQSALNASIAKRKAEEADAEITKDSLGLGNVDNTSDANKPVSTATQTALNQKLEWSAPPATAADPGTAGQIAYDATHLFICTATDTWARIALVTSW
jgi:hypothetical protein